MDDRITINGVVYERVQPDPFAGQRIGPYNAPMVGHEPVTVRESEPSLLDEYMRAMQDIKDSCDREWSDETPAQVACVVSNSIFWRNREIRKLRDELASYAAAKRGE